jgi:hypothetical protein
MSDPKELLQGDERISDWTPEIARDYWQTRAETAESKLAKAVEALRFYADPTRDLYRDAPDGTDTGHVARTALRDIEGGG